MKFEELVNRLKPKLKAIAYNLDGKYTSFDDDDLYQEGLLHLWNKYRKNELSDKTISFILQGYYFFLKNHIRKVYKKVDANSIALDEIINEYGQTLGDILPFNNWDGPAQSAQTHLLINDVRKRLTSKERKVFNFSLDGFTTREIGKKLGMSHVGVVKAQKRIRKKFIVIHKEVIENLKILVTK